MILSCRAILNVGSAPNRICCSPLPHAIAFSPHLDDAVFSCGGTLARLVSSGWDVTVCTAFTLSVANPTGFALACQLDKHLPADVDYMALRRQEDAEACQRIGCRPVWLPFAEAPHRGYSDAKALFGPLREDGDVGEALADAVHEMLMRPPDLVLAPQAVGGHVDHVQLVLALRRVVASSLQVLWWEDFPYSLRPLTHPAQPFSPALRAEPEYTIIGDAPARLQACLAYASQIGFQFGGRDGLVKALTKAGPNERLRTRGAMPTALQIAAAPGNKLDSAYLPGAGSAGQHHSSGSVVNSNG